MPVADDDWPAPHTLGVNIRTRFRAASARERARMIAVAAIVLLVLYVPGGVALAMLVQGAE